ncbi:MAG: discoidin domain-containing protein [Acidobacteriota bacterium]
MHRSTLLTILAVAVLVSTPAAFAAPVCTDQVPTLTGPSPAVTTSGDFGSTYRAWKAFDGNLTGQSMWISEVFETPAWIAYDFAAPTVVDRYTINHHNGSSLTSRAPKDFELQGWDGGAWVVVDQRQGETGWISGSPRSYSVQNPGSYPRYRLYITDDNDPRAGVVVISMVDLRFEYCGCRSTVDLVPTLTGDSPAVTTSGDFGSNYRAWKAFDALATGQSMWISEVWETPAWIAYDFGAGQLVTQYTLLNVNGSSLTSRAPKDFTLEGWDGGAWVVVDSRSEETGWQSGMPRTYDVQSPGFYSKYRLHVTDDNDVRDGVVVISLGDLQFRGCPTGR